MRSYLTFFLMPFLICALSGNLFAKNSTHHVFSAEQEKAIEKIVTRFLIQNPEVLARAQKAYQAKMQGEAKNRASRTVNLYRSSLLSKNSPSAGNPKGDVAVIEFFDYQCGHCKRMTPTVEKLLEDDKQLRLIYKELPIFGKTSQFASKAALAAAKQGKYSVFHRALMETRGRLSAQKVLDIAHTLGIDTAQLQKDMVSPEITKALHENRKIALALGFRGTPSFVILNTNASAQTQPALIRGAAPINQLKSSIEKLR